MKVSANVASATLGAAANKPEKLFGLTMLASTENAHTIAPPSTNRVNNSIHIGGCLGMVAQRPGSKPVGG